MGRIVAIGGGEIKDGENVKKISYFKHIKFIKYR